MHLSFNVNLNGIGTGLDLTLTDHPDEQEVMDFLVSVVESMADMDFTRRLIYRLAVDVSHETEAHASHLVTVLPDGTHTTFGSLYELLSYMPEDKLIALMANAMMVRRMRDAEAARNATPCDSCGHPWGAHNMACSPGLTGSCHRCMEEEQDELEPLSVIVCQCGCGKPISEPGGQS